MILGEQKEGHEVGFLGSTLDTDLKKKNLCVCVYIYIYISLSDKYTLFCTLLTKYILEVLPGFFAYFKK